MYLGAGIILLITAFLVGCNDIHDDYYYADYVETVDIDILTLLKEQPEYSKYVEILEKHNIDTLFQKGKTLTLFVPTNNVFDESFQLHLDTIDLIKYLTIESYVNLASINNNYKIRTIGDKYIELQTIGDKKYVNNVEITKASPLCSNGRFYEINSLVQPLPNLYEYISATNPFFKSYIDMQDSIYLDLALSTPIGYVDGQTIYDSVNVVVNLFEYYYFPIKSEFRNNRATMLLFDQVQFDNALLIITEKLGLPSIESIPDQWKNNILMPYLVDQGVFWNELEHSDFSVGLIRNIIGDSVKVDPANIDPNSEFLCSNGKVFSYLDFVIPDSLYMGTKRIQGEHLVVSRGFNLYSWAPSVKVTGPHIEPVALLASNVADNDSVLSINFPSNYNDEFSLSFRFQDVFPGKYRLEIRASNTPSGLFEIFVNNEKQTFNIGKGNTDFIDLFELRNPVRGINQVFRPDRGFNSFDILLENITEYGEVEVKLNYIGPGQRTSNGLVLDYVDLVSYSE